MTFHLSNESQSGQIDFVPKSGTKSEIPGSKQQLKCYKNNVNKSCEKLLFTNCEIWQITYQTDAENLESDFPLHAAMLNEVNDQKRSYMYTPTNLTENRMEIQQT